MRKLKVFYIIVIIFCFNVSCQKKTAPVGTEKPQIAVSIPPQAWFVSQIAGDKATPLVLVGSGQNPHNYEPSPKQIQGLSTAGAWILSGSEFEITLQPKIAAIFPALKIIDGTKGVRFRALEDHDDDEDEHDDIDRHTWLGREPAKILAVHIRNTLSALDETNAQYYSTQCENLIALIDEEFDKLKIELAPLRGREVFVYHPSFGYFLDEFGIHQSAVETGGKEPGPKELANLVNRLKETRAAAIFVQAQFPVTAAKTLADSADCELLVLDPLAEDWLENIRRMGQTLKRR